MRAKQPKSTKKVIEAERREMLKPKKRFETYFRSLPVVLSKAKVREMTIGALCAAKVYRKFGLSGEKLMRSAETVGLEVGFDSFIDDSRQRKAIRRRSV